jgi:hypothetical protein
MEPVAGPSARRGRRGHGQIFAVDHRADAPLVALRYRLKNAAIDVAEAPFDAAGRTFGRGTFIIRDGPASDVSQATRALGLRAWALSARQTVKTHAARAPRTAILHTWLTTQTEGWWRLAFDKLGVPYEYINTQQVSRGDTLRAKYDVILFPPVGRGPEAIVNRTADVRESDAVEEHAGHAEHRHAGQHRRHGVGPRVHGTRKPAEFVRAGGVLVGVMDTADLAVTYGLAPGVPITRPHRLKVPGSILQSRLMDENSPIAYGYDEPVGLL